jgi:hypothetical protein
MAAYRLDRNSFKGQTAEEAADYVAYYKKMKWQERLKVAAYLNSIAYRYLQDSPPRMDRTKFKVRSR